MPEVDNFSPDKTYLFLPDKKVDGSCLPPQVDDLLGRLNHEYRQSPASHFDRIITASRPPVEKDGAPYAIFTEPGASGNTALVATLPYCNPVIPDIMDANIVSDAVDRRKSKAFDSNTWNNGEKHLFLFELMKELGIRDDAGNTVPVITVGADSQDYQSQLNGEQKKALRKGDLSPYARNVERILDHLGYGRVHVSGYSQGGSVAHRFVAQADNFDVAGAVLVEAPTYKDRSILELAADYLLDPDPDGDSKWTADGPQSRKDLERIQNRAFMTMAKTIALQGAWRTALALRHDMMIPDLATAAGRRGYFPLTIGWNETSRLTEDIESTLSAPDSYNEEELKWFRRNRMLRLITAQGDESVGAPHLAGENPVYYATMIGESVQWAETLR